MKSAIFTDTKRKTKVRAMWVEPPVEIITIPVTSAELVNFFCIRKRHRPVAG